MSIKEILLSLGYSKKEAEQIYQRYKQRGKLNELLEDLEEQYEQEE